MLPGCLNVKFLSAARAIVHPSSDVSGILYCKVLSIKNYEYKQFNAWLVFSLSTAKIAKLSHIPQKNTKLSGNLQLLFKYNIASQ